MLAYFFTLLFAVAAQLFPAVSAQYNLFDQSIVFLYKKLAAYAYEQQAVFNGPNPDSDLSPLNEIQKRGPRMTGLATDLNISASSCLAIDAGSGNLLYAKDPERPQPIASITKLMTSLVFLDRNPGWDKEYVFAESDKRDGGKAYFFPGEHVKVKDLFFSMLVASDNSAVAALVHSTGMTESEFVAQMNDKAKELGLAKSSFADPTGLNNLNVSTAREVAIFAQLALQTPQIQEAVLADSYAFTTGEGKKRTVYSTDKLLSTRGQNVRIEGGKTGYLQSAGYCFVGRFSKDQHQIMTVVLGAGDINARFTETKKIVNWVYDNYRWQ
ncbi:MAG: serine hydrolase [Candidatus Falkowbacteria bacterium]